MNTNGFQLIPFGCYTIPHDVGCFSIDMEYQCTVFNGHSCALDSLFQNLSNVQKAKILQMCGMQLPLTIKDMLVLQEKYKLNALIITTEFLHISYFKENQPIDLIEI